MVTVKRNTPTPATLANLYSVIKELFDDAEVYYTEEQIKALREDKSNTFLEKKKGDRKND